MISPAAEPLWICRKCAKRHPAYAEAYCCCPHPARLEAEFTCTSCGKPHTALNRRTAKLAAEQCCSKKEGK